MVLFYARMQPLCPWEPAHYFIFSSNVPTLLFYSHLTAVLAALAFSLVVASRARESLPIKLFLATISFFSVWTIIDLPLWALNRPDADLFLWSLQYLTEMFVYVSALYFAYAFIAQKDLPFLGKFALVALLTPVIALLPTHQLFSGVDLSTCVIQETPFEIIYGYALEIVMSFLILGISFWGLGHQRERRKEIILFATGLIIFLIAFSSGNIIGSLTENWNVAQAGLFGMPVFIAFLTYTVVKFKSFNVKVFGTQALVGGIAVLIAARLFYSTTLAGTVLSTVTLAGFLVSGWFLVRSVKKEIEQREHIEKLAGELEETNKRQEVLMHFIGHEVKGSLAKSAGVLASLFEGDLGPLPETVKTFVSRALAESRQGASSVENILKASNLKKGSVIYTKEPFDLKALAAGAVEKAKPAAEEKGLALSFSAADGASYEMIGDKAQINDHVLRNLIDNAINYTPSGSVEVSLKRNGPKIIFAVKDSGIGITEEDKKRLFTEGGHGKDSQKVNVHSTGYGLFIAKSITEAHEGTIHAESAGEGKGSTFIVEFPV